MITVYFIRHATTIYNLEKKIQGRKDIPLDPEGIKEINHWKIPETILNLPCYTSPLKRAIQTAQYAGFKTYQIEPALIEMDWGHADGKSLAHYREEYGSAFIEEEAKGIDFNFFKGESPRMVQKRAWDFLQTLTSDTVCITHKGVIRALYALASNWDMKNNPEIKLKNNCIHRFNIIENKQLVIDQLNIDLSHDA